MQNRPDAPDLTGLPLRCTWTTGRVVRIVLFASISLQAVTAVIRLSSSPDTFGEVLSVVQLLMFAVFLGAFFLWTPGTLLTQDAVRCGRVSPVPGPSRGPTWRACGCRGVGRRPVSWC